MHYVLLILKPATEILV